VVFVFTVVLGCLAGCGGSGGGGGGSSQGGNNYAGTYAGEFEDSNSVTSTFSMTVTATGSITGQYNYAAGAKTFSGSVNSQGAGQITTSTGSSAITLGPPFFKTLYGGIASTNGNGAYFTLITNPNGVFGGTNPFNGSFAGTVQNTTIGKTGIDAFVIIDGSIYGSALVSVNGTPTLTAVVGDFSPEGAANYTLSVPNITVTGTVSISNGTITGPLAASNGDSLNLSLSEVQ